MPELPEVEIYRRYFERRALGKEIARIEITDRRILHRTSASALQSSLAARAFTATHRHGKHLFAQAGSGSWLYLHFGMTGDLALIARDSRPPRFSRLVVRFRNGESLAFEDMRLFGRVGLVSDPHAFVATTGLGPDPLSDQFTLERFLELLQRRRGAIKSLLMNQRNIAGLGNLWVDETLYQSGIRPKRSVERITRQARRAIYTTMRRILLAAIERQERIRPYPPSWLIESRVEGGSCPKCGGPIRRTVVFGRTTYFCAQHQK